MTSPHLNCQACLPSSQVCSHTALCNYIHTAAQISGSVSKGFYHSTSLSHSWKYFVAYKRTWLLVSELPYTVNTFNQPFPLCMQVGWYWLQLIKTITDLSIINRSTGLSSGCKLTRKKDATSSSVTVIPTLQNQQISGQNLSNLTLIFQFLSIFRAASKELRLHPHAEKCN